MRIKPSFLALVIGLLASCNRTSGQEAFIHVDEGHWAYEAKTDLQQKGILEGFPDGYFYGKRPVTRYDAVTAIQRFLDRTKTFSEKTQNTAASTLMAVFSPSEPNTEVLKQDELFQDIDQAIWHSGVYAHLTKQALLHGFPNGNYRGKRPLTRAEFAVLLARMVERQQKTPKLDIENIRFRDVAGDEWYFGAVLVAAGTGLMEGYGKGAFHPHQPLTRYELAVGLKRLHMLYVE